jgi:hypothetical protein
MYHLKCQILESTSKVAYLQFLQTICVCDGVDIRKNQDMILNELLQSELLQYTSYCNTDKMGIDELCLVMQKSHDLMNLEASCNDSSAANDFDDVMHHSIAYIDPFILFHIELVKVLNQLSAY